MTPVSVCVVFLSVRFSERVVRPVCLAQVVLVGAASKGIIQRNYQHNATVYKTPYAKNPFDQVTDEDLEEYKRFVDQKSRGTSGEDPGADVG